MVQVKCTNLFSLRFTLISGSGIIKIICAFDGAKGAIKMNGEKKERGVLEDGKI